MTELQSKLLEMFKWLTEFLDGHSLRYYVLGGTCLGAVRHKGFIPWDDDVDIGMPRKDYEKLLALLKTPQDHYVVESPSSPATDYVYPYAKFYDTDTTLTDDLRRKITRGVFIDVFPIDGIGDTEQQSAKNYKAIDRQNILLTMRTSKPRKGRKWWKNVAVFVGGLLPIDTKKLSRALDIKCATLDFDKCAYVGILANTYRFRELMPREVYGEPTQYEFEGLKVFGPARADEYLTRLYGDWRQLPPEEKRVSAHEFADIDLNKPYMASEEDK